MSRTALLIAPGLIALLGAGCLTRNAEYACVSHDDCASQLNHMCRGVEVVALDGDGACTLAEDYQPVEDPDHGHCYYAYCTGARAIVCGDGSCPAGQTCVVAKEEDYSDTRMMCLDLPTEDLQAAEACGEVDWLNPDHCDGDRVCVLSFERRAVEGDDDKARICVPITALVAQP